MNILEHMMALYDEVLEELMDAEKYAKCLEKATSTEDKSMYRGLAKQELEHGAMLERAGDKLFSGVGQGDPMLMVWHRLKDHTHRWKARIEARLSE